MRRLISLSVPSILAVFAGVVFSAFAVSAPPPKGPEHAPLQKLKVISGKVEELTKNKPGDVDGVKLESGVVIHFPPHHGKAISGMVHQGTVVSFFALAKSRPDGQEIMEAVVLQIGDQAVLFSGPTIHGVLEPHSAKEQPAKPEEPAMSASGKIASFHKNPHGDVDGFELDDKTSVKFPPHEGEKIQPSLHVGSSVTVDGRRHETPKGDVHLHAKKIISGDQTIVFDGPKPKAP